MIWASRSDLRQNQKVRRLVITDETTELKKKKMPPLLCSKDKITRAMSTAPTKLVLGTLVPRDQLPPSR